MKVIFDIEASCEDRKVNPYYNMETIEIGAVKINDGKIVGEFQTFIKPEYIDTLTPFCTELTGITFDDLEHAPRFEDAILEFYKFIYGCTIYSCGEFDRKFLVREISEKGTNAAHGVAKNAINSSHVNLKKIYNKVTGDRMKGMVGMAKNLNVTLTGKHHRGIDDARNLAKIHLKLESIRENLMKEKINRKSIRRIIERINFLHDKDIYMDCNRIIYNNKEISLLKLIDDWGDVILKDYESGTMYINNKEYKTIKLLNMER